MFRVCRARAAERRRQWPRRFFSAWRRYAHSLRHCRDAFVGRVQSHMRVTLLRYCLMKWHRRSSCSARTCRLSVNVMQRTKQRMLMIWSQVLRLREQRRESLTTVMALSSRVWRRRVQWLCLTQWRLLTRHCGRVLRVAMEQWRRVKVQRDAMSRELMKVCFCRWRQRRVMKEDARRRALAGRRLVVTITTMYVLTS